MFGVTHVKGVHLATATSTATSGGYETWYGTFKNYVRPGRTFTPVQFSWASDYFLYANPATFGTHVIAKDFKITVGPTGHSMIGWARY